MAAPRWVTLRAQWLGQQVRQLREANGLLIKDVAEYTGHDPGTVSRYETGVYPIRHPELLKLLDLYGVADEVRRFALLKLSDEVWQKGWWDGYSPDLARRALELRMTRKAILARPEPPELSVILDKALLRRQVGGVDAFAAQLRHVAACATRPNIEIRVLPFSAGMHASPSGAFKIFTMPDPFPQIAHAETPQGAVYIESPGCDRMVQVYDRLKELTLDPRESAEIIAAVAEELQ